MEGFVIRAAHGEDAETVREVIEVAYADWIVVLPDLPDVAGGIDEDIAAGRVWVAEVDGCLVGCVIGSSAAGHWHLTNIAVAPGFRGRGLGCALMAHAVAVALESGSVGMVLATHRKMHRVIALYKRLGWEVSGAQGNRVMMRRDTVL